MLIERYKQNVFSNINSEKYNLPTQFDANNLNIT
jgi:hypothetical protein